MTQKQLGEILGFKGRTSDVRIAQYESEARVPKFDLTKEMAGLFKVSTHALTVPDIDTYVGLMHTFFTLEDIYGLKVREIDGELCLSFDKSITYPGSSVDQMFSAWLIQSQKLETDEITQAEYDEWRYTYPKLDTYQHRAKIPSDAINDLFMKEFKKLDK